MSEFIELFMVILIPLVIVTVVGHGLWLLAAAILRGLTGRRRKRFSDRSTPIMTQSPKATTTGAESSTATKLQALKRDCLDLHRIGVFREAQVSDILGVVNQAIDSEQSRSIPRSNESPVPERDQPASVVTEIAASSQHVSHSTDSISPRTPESPDMVVAEAISPEAAEPVRPAHPLDKDYRDHPPEVTQDGRGSTLKTVLQSFMEDRNIRWAEIVSGVLIVGSSIGLVISLWNSFRETIPYFPALIFFAITAAIHGAGAYTLQRWRLESTSRGMLVISLMLVPLNVLIAVASRNQADVLSLVIATVLSVGLTGVVIYGSRLLMPGQWWWLATAVIGTSLSQIVIGRATIESIRSYVVLLAALPLVPYLIACSGQLQWAMRARLTPRRTKWLMTLLGVSLFSIMPPMGHLGIRFGSIDVLLTKTVMMINIVSVSLTAVGSLVSVRCTSRAMAVARVTGSALSILGVVGVLGAIAVALPEPERMAVVALVSFALLTLVALILRAAWLHLAAYATVSLACLIGLHLSISEFSASFVRPFQWLVNIIPTGETGLLLAVLSAIAMAIHGCLLRFGRLDDARYYALGGAISSIFALLIACLVGFYFEPESIYPVVVLVAYSLVMFTASIFYFPRYLAWASSVLFAVACVQLLAWNENISELIAHRALFSRQPMFWATIVHGSFATLIAVGTRFCPRQLNVSSFVDSDRQVKIAETLAQSGLVTSTLAIPIALWTYSQTTIALSAQLACITSIYMIDAFALGNRSVFAASQATGSVALFVLVSAIGQRRGWWPGDQLGAPQLQVQILVIGVTCIIWSGIRYLIWANSAAVGLIGRIRTPYEFSLLAATATGSIAMAVLSFASSIVKSAQTASVSGAVVTQSQWGGPVAWFALSACILAMIVERRDIFSRKAASTVALAAIPFLLASRIEHSNSATAALNWYFALAGAVSTAAAVLTGGYSSEATEKSGTTASSTHVGINDVQLRPSVWLTVNIAVSSIAVLFITGVSVANMDRTVHLPQLPGFLFQLVGAVATHTVPLFVVSVTLLFAAIALRSLAYARLGSVCFVLFVNTSFFLSEASGQPGIARQTITSCLQWNVTGLACLTVAWSILTRVAGTTGEGKDDQFSTRRLLDVHTGILATVAHSQAIWLVIQLVPRPQSFVQSLSTFPDWLNYVSLAVMCVFGLRMVKARFPIWFPAFVFTTAVTFFVYIASSTALLDGSNRWAGVHALQIGWTILLIASAGMSVLATYFRHDNYIGGELATQRSKDQYQRSTQLASAALGTVRQWRFWLVAIGTLLVVILFLHFENDPWSPLWYVVCSALVATVFGIVANCPRSVAMAHSATIALVGTANLCWRISGSVTRMGTIHEFVHLHVGALLVASLVWIGIEIARQQRTSRTIGHEGIFLPHRTWPVISVFSFTWIVVAVFVVKMVWQSGSGVASSVSWVDWMTIMLMGMSLANMVISLWDRGNRWAIPGLYCVGLATIVCAIDWIEPRPPYVPTALVVAIAVYTVGTGRSLLLAFRKERDFGRLQIPDMGVKLSSAAKWMPPSAVALSGVVLLLSSGIVLGSDDRLLRYCVAFAPAIAAFGLTSFASLTSGHRLRQFILYLVMFSAVLLHWSDMEPGWASITIMNRAVRALMALSVVAACYSFLAVRRRGSKDPWSVPARNVAIASATLAIAVLSVVLVLEIYHFVPGTGAPIAMAHAVAVAVMLVFLITGLIALAVLPSVQPIFGGEKGRMLYVYAAEVVAGLLFLHVHLVNPLLFQGIMRDYWPYVVMAIAFGGVGAAELLKRCGLTVLSDPVQRTGAFLPLLPAIACWRFMPEAGSYSLVLFMAGMVYIVLSATTNWMSVRYLAAVLGNASLWAVLQEGSISITEHPQFWLIPPAISALVAAHLNRNYLSAPQLSSIRYASIILIYVSSTCDLFLIGIGQSLWPPIVLMLLSVGGAFAGILLRVRPFLYLGTAFLFLSLITMVWHAAELAGAVWPWWVFGIALGAAILGMFALFERKRNEVLHLVEELRHWQ